MTAPPAFTMHRCRIGVIRAAEGAPEAIVEQLARVPDELMRSGAMVKEGDRTTIVRISRAERDYALKRYNLKGPLHTGVHLCMRSRAAWSWRSAERLLAIGLRTPSHVAMLEERAGLFRLRSFVLTEWIDGTSLFEWAREVDAARLDRLATQVAATLRCLHEHRITHGDMKATNFLIDRNDRMWLIDLDGMRRRLPGPLLAREKRKDRERFLRNWRDRPEVEAVFRAHLDRAAACGG